mmetsp:Transcript_723/g.2616  ORF Transcript_723/g.2616 Transcript_723/m.2616 type:complete len:412 (-) Transcript_723:255-1490(-)
MRRAALHGCRHGELHWALRRFPHLGVSSFSSRFGRPRKRLHGDAVDVALSERASLVERHRLDVGEGVECEPATHEHALLGTRPDGGDVRKRRHQKSTRSSRGEKGKGSVGAAARAGDGKPRKGSDENHRKCDGENRSGVLSAEPVEHVLELWAPALSLGGEARDSGGRRLSRGARRAHDEHAVAVHGTRRHLVAHPALHGDRLPRDVLQRAHRRSVHHLSVDRHLLPRLDNRVRPERHALRLHDVHALHIRDELPARGFLAHVHKLRPLRDRRPQNLQVALRLVRQALLHEVRRRKERQQQRAFQRTPEHNRSEHRCRRQHVDIQLPSRNLKTHVHKGRCTRQCVHQNYSGVPRHGRHGRPAREPGGAHVRYARRREHEPTQPSPYHTPPQCVGEPQNPEPRKERRERADG